VNGNKYYQGYDYLGYNELGWKAGVELNKNGAYFDENGNAFDGTQYYNGYDKNGLDKNGFPYIKSVEKAPLGTSATMTTQDMVYRRMTTAKTSLENNAAAVAKLFNDNSQYSQSALTEGVNEAKKTFAKTQQTNNCDYVVRSGLGAISCYIVTVIGLLENTNKIIEFGNVFTAYQTQAYSDARAHTTGPGQFDVAFQNEALNELPELYALLPNVQNGDIINYVENTYIPQLSAEIGVASGLIRTLFNQIKGWEEFYAQIDDARNQNFKPTTTASTPYTSHYLPLRTTQYVRNITTGTTAQQQSAQMGM